jgi:hypothetical protein
MSDIKIRQCDVRAELQSFGVRKANSPGGIYSNSSKNVCIGVVYTVSHSLRAMCRNLGERVMCNRSLKNETDLTRLITALYP